LLTPSALSVLDAAAISDAMHYASLAASLTCERRGADLPRVADMEKLRAAQR
jgi:fructokinase